MDIYVRVYTDQPDDVMYNLSVSSGTWVDVVEDDYHWVAFPDMKIGDEVRVQAIRTDAPNDLDVFYTIIQNLKTTVMRLIVIHGIKQRNNISIRTSSRGRLFGMFHIIRTII